MIEGTSLTVEELDILDSPLLAMPTWAHVDDRGQVTWSPEARVAVKRGAWFKLKKGPPPGVVPTPETWHKVEQVMRDVATVLGYLGDVDRYLSLAWQRIPEHRARLRALRQQHTTTTANG